MKGNTRQTGYGKAGFIMLQDCFLSCGASLLSVLMVRWLSDPIPGFTTLVLIYIGLSLAAFFVGSWLSGSHKVVRSRATMRSASRLVVGVTVKEAVLALFVIFGVIRLPSRALCVLLILSDTLFTAGILMYVRFASNIFSEKAVRQVKIDASQRNALVAGTGEASVELAKELSAEGYNVVGFITADRDMEGRVIEDVVVYCCADRSGLDSLDWRLGGVDCLFLPKGWGLNGESASGGVPVVSSVSMKMKSGMNLSGRILKRSFDIALSVLLILMFLPLGLICALAVRIEDGGPVIFRQERIGRGGRPFSIMKFRSMRQDAEQDGPELYDSEGDPRLTRVGAFLRRHHLDELPQLLNVLRGDMSFIGPRPERQYYIDKIMARNPRYAYLYQIRPGVTSYATLYNGYTDTIEKMLTRLDLDLYYLRHQSVWFDMRLLGLTFLGIVSGREF